MAFSASFFVFLRQSAALVASCFDSSSASSPRRAHLARVGAVWLLLVLVVGGAAWQLTAQTSQLQKLAISRRAITNNGRIEGTAQQLNGEGFNLNSGAFFSGDLLVPGSPNVNVNGTPSWSGQQTGSGNTLPSGYTITVNSGVTMRYLVKRSDPQPLDTVSAPPTPAGTRNLTINSQSEVSSIGSWSTVKDVTLNSGAPDVAVPPGTYGVFQSSNNSSTGFVLGVAGSTTPSVYNLQSLTLNSNSQLKCVGPVTLTLRNGLIVNSNTAILGSSSNQAWFSARVSNGGVTLNSGSIIYGTVRAPGAGTQVMINGTLYGTVQADQVVVNSGGVIKGAVIPTPVPVPTATPTVIPTATPIPNRPPIAYNQSLHLNEDEFLPFTLSATDADGDALTFSIVQAPVHGTLSGTAPNLVYTPAAHFHGTDSLTFRASDGSAFSNTATVSFVVHHVNHKPLGRADLYQTDEDTPLPVDAVHGVLSNDTDPDGDNLSAVEVSGPAHGTLSLAANGSFTYTPATNWHGTDSFVYSPKDDGTPALSGDPVTVTIVVNPTNDAPVAHSATRTTNQDTPVSGQLSASDSDGDALTFALVEAPFAGTVIVNTNGSFTYTPGAGNSGDDTFTFQVKDPSGAQSNIATQTIAINRATQPPVAVDDDYSVAQDTVLRGPTVLANDRNPASYKLSAVLDSSPSHGTLSLSVGGTFIYTPASGFVGEDSFSYHAKDSRNALSNTATVTIHVTHVNHAPVAVDDSYVVNDGEVLTVAAPGVLLNDSDYDIVHYGTTYEDVLHVALVAGQGTNKGALTLNGDGSFVYTPRPLRSTQSASDSFTYTVSDGRGKSATAHVAINIAAVNHAPVALAQSVRTPQNTPVGLSLTASDEDGDALTYVLTSLPLHGTLRNTADAPLAVGDLVSPDVRYVPASGFGGADSFTFGARDARGLSSNSATVTLYVLSPNMAPIAVSDSYLVEQDQTLSVGAPGVLQNDSDPLGYALSAVVEQTTQKGTLELSADGSFVYHPTAGYVGPDSFSYRVKNGHDGEATARVQIVVRPVNRAPMAVDDAVSSAGTALDVAVTQNDTDSDGDDLTVVSVSTGDQGGTISINADEKTVRYVPAPGFGGTETFSYTLSDGTLTDSADVTVTMTQPAPINSRGEEYWLTIPRNYSSASVPTLSVTTELDANVTVSIPGINYSKQFALAAGQSKDVALDPQSLLTSDRTIENLGVHIVADQPVSAYLLNYQRFETEGYMGIPVRSLGKEYRAISYYSLGGLPGTIALVSPQNDTSVTITPSGGTPSTVTLNQGQTYQFLSQTDVSGFAISSSKPVAVFSGNSCANVPQNQFSCNQLVEQVPPISSWGKQFVSVPLARRSGGDFFRFLAQENDTTVSVNGVAVGTLAAGQFVEKNLTQASFITSSKPILVTQYSTGQGYDYKEEDVVDGERPYDPFMALVPSTDQYASRYTLTTPASGISANFVNITIPTSAKDKLRFDGQPLSVTFTSMGNSNYSGVAIPVTVGPHNISTVDGTEFGVVAYGWDAADAYGYPGALGKSPIVVPVGPTPVPTTGADIVAPVVSVTQPGDGSIVGSLNWIAGQARDNEGGSGILGVSFEIKRQSDGLYWTGSEWGTKSELSTERAGASWWRVSNLPNGSLLPEGTYTITATAFDKASNASTPRSVAVHVERSSPRVAFSNPLDGQAVTDLNVVDGVASDSGRRIAKVELALRNSDNLYWNGTSFQSVPVFLSTTYANEIWSKTTGLPGASSLPVGAYSLLALATSQSGRQAQAAIVVQVTSPVVPTSTPTPYVTPTSAPARPDGIVAAADSTSVGDDIYNADGKDQIAQSHVPAGGSVEYTLTLQNDSASSDSLIFVGPASKNGWTLSYISPDGSDITTAVTSSQGWTTPSLASGESVDVSLKVVAPVTGSSGLNLLARAYSSRGDVFDTFGARTLVDVALPTPTPSPLPAQPDGWIRSATGGATDLGNGVYNLDGEDQTARGTAVAGASAVYALTLQNDAPTPDTMVLHGPAHENGGVRWSVRYFDALTGGTDITSQVTSTNGWSTSALNAGDKEFVRVEVAPDATVTGGSTFTTPFTLLSSRDFGARDVVVAVTANSFFPTPTAGATPTPTVDPTKDDAVFVSGSVPATMVTGRLYRVAERFQNTGGTTWNLDGTSGTYTLASEEPSDNVTWGMKRVSSGGATVAPGQSVRLEWTVQAPSVPGTYAFAWRMNNSAEGKGRFGQQSEVVQVVVGADPNVTPTPVATSTPVATPTPTPVPNPQVPQGGSNTFGATAPFPSPPASIWGEILDPQGTVMASFNPSNIDYNGNTGGSVQGWKLKIRGVGVPEGSSSSSATPIYTVTAPADAVVATGYLVRSSQWAFANGQARFDVIPAGQTPLPVPSPVPYPTVGPTPTPTNTPMPTPTAAPSPAKVDALVLVPGDVGFVGDDFYSSQGSGIQSVSVEVPGIAPAQVSVAVENDGAVASKMRFLGPSSDNGWTLRYLAVSTDANGAIVTRDVTAQVTGAGFVTASALRGPFEGTSGQRDVAQIVVVASANDTLALGATRALAVHWEKDGLSSQRDAATITLTKVASPTPTPGPTVEPTAISATPTPGPTTKPSSTPRPTATVQPTVVPTTGPTNTPPTVTPTVAPPPEPPTEPGTGAVVLHSPADGVELTAQTGVTGTVGAASGQAQLVNWQLLMRLQEEGAQWREMATGTTTQSNARLATLDPTLLVNGLYRLQLTANYRSEDGSTSTAFDYHDIVVKGGMKIGHFTLSFNDLSLPVAGMPISVVRTYDSRDAVNGRKGEFGVGWSLSTANVRLQSNGAAGGIESTDRRYWSISGSGLTKTIRNLKPRMVTITLPDGQVYSFKAAVSPTSWSALSGTVPDLRMSWIPQRGTKGTLRAADTSGIVEASDTNGKVLLTDAYSDTQEVYDPQEWELRLPNGTKMHLTQTQSGGQGKIDWIQDLTGNVTRFGEAGIRSYDPDGRELRSALFTRDGQGYISKVTDATGKSVTYTRDGSARLTAVTNRVNETTRFGYRQAGLPFYLTHITDPGGIEALAATFDSQGRLAETKDAAGRPTRVAHDLDKRQEIITDALGNRTVMTYDNYGNVSLTEAELKDRAGKLLRWVKSSSTYTDPDNPDQPTSVSAFLENGHAITTTMRYDQNGNVLEVTDPLNHKVQATYNDYNQILSVTDTLNRVVVRNVYWNNKTDFWTFSTPGGGVQSIRQPQSALRETRDILNHATSFFYDAQGRLAQVTDAQGRSSRMSTDFLTGNVTGVTDALGHSTNFTYDALGRKLKAITSRSIGQVSQQLVSETRYDAEGRPTISIAPDNVQNRVFYNTRGQVESSSEAFGTQVERITGYRYNDLGQKTSTILPDGGQTRTEYDELGRAQVTYDRVGRGSYTEFDSLGRAVRSYQVKPGTGPATSRFVLDAAGEPLYTETRYDDAGRAVASRDTRGRWSTTTYDDASNVLSSTDSLNHTTRTRYDELNRPIEVTDAKRRVTTMFYDAAGRMWKTQFADGTTTQTRFDELNRPIESVDQRGIVRRTHYDALGRVNWVEMPVEDGQMLRTRFGYNELGQRIWQQDAQGVVLDRAAGLNVDVAEPVNRVTRFAYDERGRLIQRVLPGTFDNQPLAENMVYNELGQLVRKRDFKGYWTRFEYDDRGRMILKSPDPALQEAPVVLSYPDEFTTIAQRGAAKTVSHSNPVRGWLTGLEVTSPKPTGGVTNSTVSFAHDVYGRTQSKTIESGSGITFSKRTTSFGYDGLDRLNQITANDGATWGYDYDEVGNKKSLTRPNGTTTNYHYDQLNRLDAMKTLRGTPSQIEAGTAALVSRFDYHLRDDGRRDALAETLVQPDGTTTTRSVAYEFDLANRLTGESGTDGEGKSYSKNYTLDAAGNRLSSNYSKEGALVAQTSYSYNSLDWLAETSVQSSGGTSTTRYAYNAAGEQIGETKNVDTPQEATTGQKWDFEGHLLAQGQVNTSGNFTGDRTTYAYDANGMRLSQATVNTTGAVTDATSYLWDGDRVSEERDENGVLQASYEHGQELGPLRLLRKAGTPTAPVWQTRHFIGDGQDSTRQLLDENGDVKDSYFYDAFGTQLHGNQGDTLNAFKYTGQQQDSNGLYYLRARYYQPGTGRFLSHDPEMGSSADPISMHRYLYAGANPVNGVDPTGRSTMIEMSMVQAISKFLVVNAAFGAGTSFAQANAREMSLGAQAGAAASGAWEATVGIVELAGQIAYNSLTLNPLANAELGLNIGAGLIQWHIDMLAIIDDPDKTPAQRATAFAMLVGSALSISKMARGAVKSTPGQKVAGYMNRMGREILDEDGGGLGRGGCFVAGTRVVMADGRTKRIEQVKVGDWVLSRDAKTRTTRSKRVEHISVRQVAATRLLVLSNGSRIETTDEHPFYVQGKAFVKAKELGIGCSIVTRAGPPLRLRRSVVIAKATTVYNFTVEGFHTYFVQAKNTDVWVHNLPCSRWADPAVLEHILNGDVDGAGNITGGGHLHGTEAAARAAGKWAKTATTHTEFPASWTDQTVADAIEAAMTNSDGMWDVNPNSGTPRGLYDRLNRNTRTNIVGTYQGVDMTVVFEARTGKVVTAFPGWQGTW